MLGKENIDGGLKHKGIVDGNRADFRTTKPAWLAAAGM